MSIILQYALDDMMSSPRMHTRCSSSKRPVLISRCYLISNQCVVLPLIYGTIYMIMDTLPFPTSSSLSISLSYSLSCMHPESAPKWLKASQPILPWEHVSWYVCQRISSGSSFTVLPFVTLVSVASLSLLANQLSTFLVFLHVFIPFESFETTIFYDVLHI